MIRECLAVGLYIGAGIARAMYDKDSIAGLIAFLMLISAIVLAFSMMLSAHDFNAVLYIARLRRARRSISCTKRRARI
jgi:hypothetical protein